MIINGVTYNDKDLDFVNILCDLEDMDIDVMNFGGKDMKPFTLCRGIISVYTGEKDLNKCGKMLSEHLTNGGELDDILDPFTKAMEAAGFGKAAEPTKGKPQDHQKPVKKTSKEVEKTE